MGSTRKPQVVSVPCIREIQIELLLKLVDPLLHGRMVKTQQISCAPDGSRLRDGSHSLIKPRQVPRLDRMDDRRPE